MVHVSWLQGRGSGSMALGQKETLAPCALAPFSVDWSCAITNCFLSELAQVTVRNQLIPHRVKLNNVTWDT